MLGHNAEEIRSSVNLPIRRSGGEFSLIGKGRPDHFWRGWRQLESDELEGILLCLVDHPLISADVVRKLARGVPNQAAAAGNSHSPGRARPSGDLYHVLCLMNSEALVPGEGANLVTRRHREETLFVEVDERSILNERGYAFGLRKADFGRTNKRTGSASRLSTLPKQLLRHQPPAHPHVESLRAPLPTARSIFAALISSTSAIDFPFIISVSTDPQATEGTHPDTLNFTSATFPFSTRTQSFRMSPQAGLVIFEPRRSHPAISPTLRGFSKWSRMRGVIHDESLQGGD